MHWPCHSLCVVLVQAGTWLLKRTPRATPAGHPLGTKLSTLTCAMTSSISSFGCAHPATGNNTAVFLVFCSGAREVQPGCLMNAIYIEQETNCYWCLFRSRIGCLLGPILSLVRLRYQPSTCSQVIGTWGPTCHL